MKTKDFINGLSNPLDDEKVFDEIINCYSKDNNLYNELIKVNIESKIYGYCNPEQKEKLELFLFNKWKEGALNVNIDK